MTVVVTPMTGDVTPPGQTQGHTVTDKYTFNYLRDDEYFGHGYALTVDNVQVAVIVLPRDNATPDDTLIQRIDNALNATSRAGSKSSQAKRDAAKSNIAKRWQTVIEDEE